MNLPGLYVGNVSNLPRAMIFVDGENLSIRYGEMLGGGTPHPQLVYEKEVFVWCSRWGNLTQGIPAIMRKYYYTSVSGGSERVPEIELKLKDVGIEAPRVFFKQKDRRSKGVDISLSTDMLLHAARKHYDIAVLIGGDGDYVPLVKAVQGEGARVLVWALSNGFSPDLKNAADESRVLDMYFFGQ